MKSHLVVSIMACITFMLGGLLLTGTSAQATGGTVVGIGSAASCNEAALTAAVAAGGAISFNCGSSKVTITLTKELVIAVDSSLDSAGLVTISGGGKLRVMHVKLGIHLDLNRITLAQGKASDSLGNGGDLWNENGIVKLTDTTVEGGSADHKGAGIFSQGGTLTLVRVTLSNGKAGGDGGALYIENGKAMLSNVTVSTNSAAGKGAGLVNVGGMVDLVNVTLYKNTAPTDGTDIYNTDANQSSADTSAGQATQEAPSTGGTTIQNSQITLKNTIIANDKPKDPKAPPILNCKDVTQGGNAGKNIVDGGKNLQYPDNSCGGNIEMANPRLAVLGNYGHYSKTHALLAGSPAIDTAAEAVCEADPVGRLDERNVRRPFGPVCDIGAYEYVIIPPTATPVPPTPQPSQPHQDPHNPPPPVFIIPRCPPGYTGRPPNCLEIPR